MASDSVSIETQQPIPQEVNKSSELIAEKSKPPLIQVPENSTDPVDVMELRDQYGSQEKIGEIREQIKEKSDLYENSSLIQKLKERQQQRLPLKIACLDLDSTLTGSPSSQQETRRLLEEKGFTVVFVTSRTEEMLMSKDQYTKSLELGFKRKKPKLGTDNQGKRIYAYADEVESFKGLYDPDVIAATTGARIFVQQQDGGYQSDSEFDATLKDEADVWRENTLRILRHINKDGNSLALEPLKNNEKAYVEGDTDVFPPDFRLALDLIPKKISENTGATGGGQKATEEIISEGLSKRSEFLKRFRALREDPSLPEDLRKHLSNIKITNGSNPDTGKFAVYLNPTKGLKERAVENIVDKVCKGLSSKDKAVTRKDLQLLIAGDSFPDLAMGLYGGIGTNATFLLVGSSRLTDVLTTTGISNFAGEGISSIKNRMSENAKGDFSFKMPLEGFYGGSRRIIIGDQIYPGTKSVETVKAFLKSSG